MDSNDSNEKHWMQGEAFESLTRDGGIPEWALSIPQELWVYEEQAKLLDWLATGPKLVHDQKIENLAVDGLIRLLSKADGFMQYAAITEKGLLAEYFHWIYRKPEDHVTVKNFLAWLEQYKAAPTPACGLTR